MRLLYFFICLFVSFSCFAQRQNKNALVLSAGPAFPAGDYGRKELQDPETGFAKTGPQVQIAFLQGRNRFGWVVAFAAQRNSMNTRSMEQQLAEKNFYHGVYVGSTANPIAGDRKSTRLNS